MRVAGRVTGIVSYSADEGYERRRSCVSVCGETTGDREGISRKKYAAFGREAVGNYREVTARTSAMTKSFRGEGDLMVDALVSASQQAYNMGGGQPMPGYGRDLVPYFDGGDGAPISQKPRGGQITNAVQPPPPPVGDTTGADILAMLNGHAPAPPTPAAVPVPAPAKKNTKKAKPVKPKAGGNVPAPIVLNNGFTYEVQQPDPVKQKAAKKTAKIKLEKANDGPPPPTAAQRWAGPSFQSSPAPNALPVPAFMKGAGVPATAPKPPTDGGADIMAILGQTQPPAPPAPAALKEASAPDLMAMLNISPEPVAAVAKPAAIKPPPAPVHKTQSAPALLTPDMLAAMAGGRRGAPVPSASAAARERSTKLLAMRQPIAPAPVTQAAGNAEFQSLLRKLESSA